MKAAAAKHAFQRAIEAYHAQSEVDPACPETADGFESPFFQKAWIDTVQWHLEDEIRRPDLSGPEVLALKRRIDALNQARTDAVEALDRQLQSQLQPTPPSGASALRTESLGWALDRLCILQLKRYHMAEEVARGGDHATRVAPRLEVLDHQSAHLEAAIDSLVDDLRNGLVAYARYEQHKLYNDPDTNPALYRVT
jgi:hypothetical protein